MLKKAVTSFTAACLIMTLPPGTIGKAVQKDKPYHLKDSTLRDKTIEGDLVITPDAGENITLENVTVLGETLIKGEAPDTLQLTDSELHSLSIQGPGHLAKITVSGESVVEETELEGNVILEENEITFDGFQNVTVSASHVKTKKADLKGEFDTVSTTGKKGEAQVELDGIAERLELNALSSVALSSDGVVKELLVSQTGKGSTIDGEGSIEKATLNSEIEFNGKETSDAASFVTPWSLVWNDEFNEEEIDRNKWTFDIGNGYTDANGTFIPGWGNNERQYYTDRPENARTEDGKLLITAKKEDYKGYAYTSSRLKTKGLFSKTYGKFEMKASLPVGKGYWPAFWMLPEDDRYGGWAASGEIDILEAQGSNPGEAIGTLHYGESWPNNKYTGTHYAFEGGSTIADEHVYSVEWEPGEIRWYVDGKLRQTQNNWYSKGTGNAANFTYPAPFDQPFHMLLNLAIGGNFDGDPTEETMFPQSMDVDYVRVYDLTGRPYQSPELPVFEQAPLPDDAKQPLEDGNLIYNNGFNQDWEDVDGIPGVENTDYWYFLTVPDFGGKANVSLDQVDGSHFAKVDVEEPGSQPYSVQLIQDVSLGKGRYYRVSFDAKSTGSRPINVKVGGGADRGYSAYSNSEAFSLTDELESYEMVFQMTEENDLAARVEFNLGLSKLPVWLGNVRVEEIPPVQVDPDASKPALSNGNLLYNGTFDQGFPDRLLFWNLIGSESAESMGVDPEERVFAVKPSSETDEVGMVQKGVQLKALNEYELTFDGVAESDRDLVIELRSKDGEEVYATETISLTTDWDNHAMKFTMPDVTDLESQLFIHLGGSTDEVKLDNFKLKKIAGAPGANMIQNGSFDTDLEFWENYIHVDASAAIMEEDGQAKISIENEGNETWSVQLYQGGLKLEPGVEYTLSFDASSTVDRTMEVTVENAGYHRYLSEVVQLGGDKAHYEYTFTMPASDSTSLKFLLGKSGSSIGAHDVEIDNVVLK
ncbi:carbohydrate binding domain-containing protein [Rossellomorea aquimaris]|uniref:carbohydrate binding domain-containing protein n=1 Tax=Rossellomorea aquimaris TaxID=189382 RepID=UPI001CD274E1|nr:carbohydrate binding domain-containing protein [Rossellomorea aquimaris]MCA1060060.1 carbohydrate binding domain-containing protein [Rossellomorea aquimaris]